VQKRDGLINATPQRRTKVYSARLREAIRDRERERRRGNRDGGRSVRMGRRIHETE